MSKSETSNLTLELGDIIQIESPTNPDYNNHIFIINYLDDKNIILIDGSTLEKKHLTLKDGSLTDESIISISILSKAPVKGYARQNNLLTGTWIDIHFGGELPITITGEITDLEEDRIELTTYPDKDVIYIDFGYKGIPTNLPIEKITIRSEPVTDAKLSVIAEIPDEEHKEDYIEGKKETTREDDVPSLGPFVERDSTTYDIKTKITNILAEADDIVFGTELDAITQEIQVSEDEKRYNITTQTNDLLDELLSKIPNVERTTKVLNNIHRLISRFVVLRKQFSNFDKQGIMTGIKSKGAHYKPLVEKLQQMNTNLYWIIPVVTNKRKLYDIVDYDDITDIVPLTLAESRVAVTDIIDAYYNNKFPESQNKYRQMITQLNPYFTPFTKPTDLTNVIDERPVQQNIHVLIDNVIDNLEDFYSSVAKSYNPKETISFVRNTQYVMSKYNTGLTQLQMKSVRRSKVPDKIVPLTESDIVSIKSFMILQEPFVRYSHISLPGTTIYDKANLNKIDVAYWRLFNKKTSITTDVISDVNKNYTYESKTFLKNIKEIILDPSIDEEDKYSKFLQAFVPQTRVLFNLIEKYIQNKTNYTKIIEYLEPFMIYKDDITFMQYKEIVDYIQKNKSIIIGKLESYKKHTNILRNLKISIQYGGSILLSMLNGTIFSRIEQKYNLYKHMLPSETYAKIITTDCGNLYNTSLSILDNSLYSDTNISEKLIEKIDLLKLDIQKEGADKECKNLVLAKKYIDHDELIEDDEVEIFFDKKYDETRYEILNEYSTEQDSMSAEDFNVFLKQELESNVGMSPENAENEAEAMIKGNRPVKDGHYAILETFTSDGSPKKYYYVRENNRWIFDEDITEQTQTDETSIFCNSKAKCLQIKQDCTTTTEAKAKINSEITQQIVRKLMDAHEYTSTQMVSKLNKEYKYYDRIIDNIVELTIKENLRNNNKQYTYGLDVEHSDVIKSPYEFIRDMILGQQDFVKKIRDIKKFINRYTRQAVEGEHETEDTNWLYCSETNVKLLPSFYASFIDTDINPYEIATILDEICKERGVLSDDGNKWVDKYSGYTIKLIDFDTEEGYDEQGFKLRTRGILEEDLGQKVLQEGKIKGNTSDSASIEVRFINNIIKSLSHSLGINIESQREFIIRNTLLHIQSIHGDKEKYDSIVAKSAKKGKKMATYETLLHQFLLYFSALYILIAIQTAIPSVKTKKTYPNCKKSFDGFPFILDGTDEGLTYIACIMKKTASATDPWSAIRKMKVERMVKTMKGLYTKYLLKYPEVQNKIEEKRTYIETKEDDDFIIPPQLDVSRWQTFLPPLTQIHIKEVRQINDLFRRDLLQNIQSGNIKQLEQLSIIQSKTILYSFAIQEKIQQIISEKTALLETMTGEPFLENTCCSAISTKHTYNYFVNKNKGILEYNNHIRDLSKLYNDTLSLIKAPFMYSNLNTKLRYPPLQDDFSEKTIYLAFIKFCKYNSIIPISDAIKAICIDNKSEFINTDTIDEKITILKREGRNYTIEAFVSLINVINRENIINMSLHSATTTRKQRLENLLEYFKTNPTNIPTELVSHLLNVIDTFDIVEEEHSDNYNDLLQWLHDTNEKTREDTIRFLHNGDFNRRTKNIIDDFLNNFTKFVTIEDTDILSSKDMTTIHKINYIKNCIIQMINVFPQIILNKVSYDNDSIDIPKHWNLSMKHTNDMKNIISSTYSNLSVYYGNPILSHILNNIHRNMKDILRLMEETPYNTSVDIGDKQLHYIFDSTLVLELYKYYFLQGLQEYITLQNDVVVLTEDDVDITTTIDDIEEGQRKITQTTTADLLKDYINIFIAQKKVINYNKETINERILRIKDKEKDRKTRTLKELTIQERELDTQFKSMKLGRWNKGLQKGLTQYVRETYDEERLEMEQEAVLDIQLGLTTEVMEMNRDIFRLDALEKQLAEKQIEADVYTMRGMANDDDFAEGLDGDEYM